MNPLFCGKLILAPLAGVNDVAFRVLCRRHGADIVYTGMVNATALVRKNKATERLAVTCNEERPVAIQLFGYDEKILAKAAQIVENDCDIIDINMGCPDADVVRQGAGAALLRRPAKVERIVAAVKAAIKVPLTVKIRSGFEKQDLSDTIKIARIIEKAGADAIIVHPRTVKQGYSGKSDWSIIKEVKAAVSIPVIGNGDVRSIEDYNSLKAICDSVMIGRAAMASPLIFEDIKTGHTIGVSEELKLGLFKEYLSLVNDHGILGTINLRQRAQMLLSGFKGSAVIRSEISAMSDDEIIARFVK